MHIKREDVVHQAHTLLSRALYFNLAVVLLPPLYILFSKSISTETYAALVFLAFSLASLFTVLHVRRAVDDYDIDTALKALGFGVVLGLVGGVIIVGILALKVRNILKTI